jgi:hypothetical protein
VVMRAFSRGPSAPGRLSTLAHPPRPAGQSARPLGRRFAIREQPDIHAALVRADQRPDSPGADCQLVGANEDLPFGAVDRADCERGTVLGRQADRDSRARRNGGRARAHQTCERYTDTKHASRDTRRSRPRESGHVQFRIYIVGWRPWDRSAVRPWRPAVCRVGAAKCPVYSDWGRYQVVMIPAARGRSAKILANYAAKFAARPLSLRH